jgi:hypothetical protein
MDCRILRDHTDSSGVHSQALDSLQAKLSEVEAALQREQGALKQVQVCMLTNDDRAIVQLLIDHFLAFRYVHKFK